MSDLELPALELVKENHERTSAIHEFLEVMAEKGYHLTKIRDDCGAMYAEVVESTISLGLSPQLDDHLYEFIGTTADEVEKERQALLKSIGG